MSMSCDHLSNDIPECPLCLEPFSLDDINFYPCACRYQICRFCWHRIRTDENGLCPHCREPYSENPAEYTPPSQDQLVKLKHDKKQKTHDKKQKLIESRKNLSSLRVVQKNLVFVIGLSPRLAEPEILRKNEYFGKYGKIYKVVINNSTVYNGSQGPSVSAYVTYYREEDASKAIQAVNNAFIDGRHLKASYGTTKYCTYFLRGSQCTKPDCMYLHEMGNEEASFTKEDMQAGKHQVFESQTLAASNTGMILVGREQGGQTLTKKQQQQDPLLTTAKEIELESALPASASWGTRQTGGGLLPLPQMKEGKAQSSSTKHKSQKSQKHSSSHTKSSDGSGGKSSGRGSRSSDPLSPHSILGPGPGFDTGTTRRHNSTGSRIEHSSSNTRSTSITRSNSTAASVSSKSVSPDLSPKSSLSTSSSCGSLKQDFEGREGGTAMNSEHEITRDVEVSFGKPHPLESTVSRQLDSIDLDDEDDWGLQEVRANDDVISETSDTVTMATDTTNMIKTRSLTHQTSVHESIREKAESTDRESMRQDPVDVISSLGSTATGQFGSLGVSWNSGAPPLATNSSPPLSPSQYSGPGEQNTAQTSRQMERNQTPDDDLGFDPWDESARGLAALLETEQQPSHSRLTASSTVNGPDRRGGGMIDTLASSTGTFDSTTNLSWQDELKTVFPNVNISFGVPSSSTSVPIQQRLATPTTTSSSTPSQFSSSTVHSVQTPLQQAINGAAQSHSFPYHQGVGGMGALFGYATPAQLHSMPDYRSLYEASPTNQSLLASVRSAFDAPKLPNTSTTNTPSTDPTQSSSTDSTSISNRDMAPGYTSMNGIQTSKGYVGSSSNTIEWPDLAAASGVTAVGSKRTAKNGSTSGTGNTGTGLLSSNVATWNGSMGNGILAGNGNGGTKDSATGVIGTTNSTARSKETSSSSGAIAPPPGFTTKSSKDNMSLSSSINNALWNNNTLTKGGAGQAAGVGATQQTNPAMTNQILQNWAKYLQMNFGGLTRQQLANNPLYQQMVRQQQQYWAMLRQQQLLQLQQAGVAAAGGVSVPGRNVLTPAQIQQLQTRMALSQSALNQATAHARLQQQHHLQQTLKHSHQQAHQQTRNSLGHIGIPVATVPVSGQSVANLGQTVRLGQPQGGAVGGVLSQSSNKSSQQSQNVPSK